MFKLLVPFLFLCGGALAGTPQVTPMLDINGAGKLVRSSGTDFKDPNANILFTGFSMPILSQADGTSAVWTIDRLKAAGGVDTQGIPQGNIKLNSNVFANLSFAVPGLLMNNTLVNSTARYANQTGTPFDNGIAAHVRQHGEYRIYHAFNGITTTDTGRWIDTRIYKTVQILVTCAASGGVNSGATLYVSGHADYAGTGTAPSHATHGVDIGSAIVVGLDSNRTTVTGLDNYTKIRITAQDAATVYADLVFRQ